MKRFHVIVEIDVPDEKQVMRKFLNLDRATLLDMKPKIIHVGFVHPDGSVQSYDVPPEGYTVFCWIQPRETLPRVGGSYIAVPDKEIPDRKGGGWHEWFEERIKNYRRHPPGSLSWHSGKWNKQC